MKPILSNILYYIFSPFLIRNAGGDSIYITFDDGPHPEYTLKVADILSKHKVMATFFMVGREMEKYPEIVKEIISRGHSIGYHSFAHKNMRKMGVKEFVKDFRAYRKVGVKSNAKLYRPPYGVLTIFGLFWLIVSGWKIVMWSRDSRDSFEPKEKILANVSPELLEKGDILLFHDDYKDTAEILDELLTQYESANVKCSLISIDTAS